MRKILLATTALVGFAISGAALAAPAPAPLNVTVGGSVDFLAGAFHESRHSALLAGKRTNKDFETLYSLDFGVAGKSASGVEYGGNLVLDNYPSIQNNLEGGGDGLTVTTADIFMSGAFGKIVMGDSRGATDLMLTIPSIGAGQVTGRYADFVYFRTFAKGLVDGVDGTDHSTNVTYYTPRAGNDMHKVQLGVTFEPNFNDYGGHVVKYRDLANYTNMIKGAIAYTGNFKPVKVGISSHIITAAADQANSYDNYRPSTSWGVEARAAVDGFTLGGTYTDLGHFGTISGYNKDQQTYGAGLTYDFCCKLAVGASYLGGQGYNLLSSLVYVNKFNTYSVGGTYTWAPGLATSVDGVMFNQKDDLNVDNDGYVLLVSQKLAF